MKRSIRELETGKEMGRMRATEGRATGTGGASAPGGATHEGRMVLAGKGGSSKAMGRSYPRHRRDGPIGPIT